MKDARHLTQSTQYYKQVPGLCGDREKAMSLKTLKLVLAGLLLALILDGTAARFFRTTPVLAQSGGDESVYIEPGVRMLRAPDGSRQVLGKVVVDLRNGNVWGFPTTVDQPYPVDITSQQPPTSKPFLLGKFDFSGMRGRQ